MPDTNKGTKVTIYRIDQSGMGGEKASTQKYIEVVTADFNPSEYTLDKSIQIAEVGIPGLDNPLQQFVRGNTAKLTTDLFFDTSNEGLGKRAKSVTEKTDELYNLVKIDSKLHAPPICYFAWGPVFPGSGKGDPSGTIKEGGFVCIFESIKQRFTLFSEEGIPLRATVSVTLREYKTLHTTTTETNPQSPDRTHNFRLKSDQTLSEVAHLHYDTPTAWRPIAEENGLEDPRRIDPGTLLTIASLR